MVNIGIIGVWHVHTNDYAAQLKRSGKGTITAVWDEDAAVGGAWAQEHGVPFEADYDAFLARTDVQAVICNAPTTRHGELLTKAAAAGKHIFTEKLLATTTEDAERICQAVEAAHVICTVSLPLLSDNKIRYARRLMDDGALGRVTAARMRRSHSGVSDGWLPERWFDLSRSGGGALMDLGAHPVYVLAYLLGVPVRVSGMLTNLYGTSSDENAIALVEFAGGVLGTCETGFATYGVPDLLEVYGTEGSLFIHGNDVKLANKALKGLDVSCAVPDALPPSMPLPLDQFLDACQAGGASPANLTPRDALVMTQIVEAAYRSDREGRTVTL